MYHGQEADTLSEGGSGMSGRKKGIAAGMIAAVIAVIGIVCVVLRKRNY